MFTSPSLPPSGVGGTWGVGGNEGCLLAKGGGVFCVFQQLIQLECKKLAILDL
jgi:hypothetical protein